jgi:hypothetical protein
MGTVEGDEVRQSGRKVTATSVPWGPLLVLGGMLVVILLCFALQRYVNVLLGVAAGLCAIAVVVLRVWLLRSGHGDEGPERGSTS